MSEQDQQGTGNLGEEATLARLAAEGVAHELVEHPAVWTMEDVEALDPPHPGADAKNLLVRDDKKRGYHLLTVQGDKRVDLGPSARHTACAASPWPRPRTSSDSSASTRAPSPRSASSTTPRTAFVSTSTSTS